LDNVYTATDEGDVTLFHNFDGETSFDLAKWLVAGMGTAHVVPGD
jgi:hypothetical protein